MEPEVNKKMISEENLVYHEKMIRIASEIMTLYEKEQNSLRNAMKSYGNFSEFKDIQSYSQVHALVFETVRFQNIFNRIIHKGIQSTLDTKIPVKRRNILRIISYLRTIAPKSQKDDIWDQTCKRILTSFDKDNQRIFSQYYDFFGNPKKRMSSVIFAFIFPFIYPLAV